MTDEPIVTTGEVVPPSGVSGEWLAPPMAASRLGISERTLWRYIDQGKYHKRVRDRRAEILVPVSGATPPPSSETALAPTPDTGAMLAKLDEIERRLTRQSMTVTRQAVHITRQADTIKQLRDQLAAQATALEAARGEVARLKRPWWRRMWP